MSHHYSGPDYGFPLKASVLVSPYQAVVHDRGLNFRDQRRSHDEARDFL